MTSARAFTFLQQTDGTGSNAPSPGLALCSGSQLGLLSSQVKKAAFCFGIKCTEPRLPRANVISVGQLPLNSLCHTCNQESGKAAVKRNGLPSKGQHHGYEMVTSCGTLLKLSVEGHADSHRSGSGCSLFSATAKTAGLPDALCHAHAGVL